MDVEWALDEVAAFRRVLEGMQTVMDEGALDPVLYATSRSESTRALRYEYDERRVVIKEIAKVLGVAERWMRATTVHDSKSALAEIGALLQRRDEIAERLGPVGPSVRVSEMHPWVWSAASTFWNDGHYRIAVAEAAEALNRHLQAKLGRTDISGADLARQAYSSSNADFDAPRLRPTDADEGSESYKARISGARDFAAGCFTLIRNMAAHDGHIEWTEVEAAEALAALSLLARRIQADSRIDFEM